MRIRRRAAFILTSAMACAVGLIAFPVSAWAPPVVPACTPATSTGSDSCVTLKSTGLVGTPPGPIGAGPPENVKLGFRVRAIFSPPPSAWNSVILRFDDNIALNLAAVPSCPSAELTGKTIAAAWEQCGPGADGSPPSEGNAYLSTGLGNSVSGISSTTPFNGGIIGCTMVFKGANNNSLTLYLRAPVPNSTTGCNGPATNTGGSATIVFTGTLANLPAASPYGKQLTVPNIHIANPDLDDFYATLTRGAVFRATCPATEDPHKVQGTFDYTAVGDATDVIQPPYQTPPNAGTQDSCTNLN